MVQDIQGWVICDDCDIDEPKSLLAEGVLSLAQGLKRSTLFEENIVIDAAFIAGLKGTEESTVEEPTDDGMDFCFAAKTDAVFFCDKYCVYSHCCDHLASWQDDCPSGVMETVRERLMPY
jgi:hypothetical protein